MLRADPFILDIEVTICDLKNRINPEDQYGGCNVSHGRFPDDFVFQHDREELVALRCQIGTSKTGKNAEQSVLLFSRVRYGE